MEEMYAPPFRMTEEITNLVIEIGECVGKISASDAATKDPKLRRVNRMQTIHATLAIEQNALTLEQVTAVIQGKRVLAPPQDICEVKNAYEAYEHMREFDPYSMEDLLKAHRFMMRGLVEEAGCLRTSNVGVYAQDRLVHMAPPAERVGDLMRQLFRWLRTSRLHPLVKSCIFHYELEFIHPFADGNGRMGRLWHCLILQRWQPFFAYLPIETLIHEKQEGYYQAIQAATAAGESAPFVAFLLQTIRAALAEFSSVSPARVGENVGEDVGESQPLEERCLDLLRRHPRMSARELAQALGVSARHVERLLAAGKKKGRLRRRGRGQERPLGSAQGGVSARNAPSLRRAMKRAITFGSVRMPSPIQARITPTLPLAMKL